METDYKVEDDVPRAIIQYAKCPCSNCGSPIEFPADAIGENADCPHCGRVTKLAEPEMIPEPPPYFAPPEPASAHQLPPPLPSTKKCPFCAEEILQAAIKCKHCGEHLVARAEPPAAPSVAEKYRQENRREKEPQEPRDVSSGVFWGLFKFFILLPIVAIVIIVILGAIFGISHGR